MVHSYASYGGMLRRYLGPLWRTALLMAVLLLTAIAIELLGPQILRVFIDTAEQGGPLERLAQAALVFLGVALVGQAVRVAATWQSEQVGWRATNTLRSDLLRHVLSLDLGFHRNNPPGALIERVDGDVNALASFFSRFVVELVGNGLLLVGTLTLITLESWQAGAAVAVYALATLLVLGRVQHLGAQRWSAALQSEADLAGFLDERLRGTEDIRANGAEGFVLAQLDTTLRKQLAVLLPAFMARSLIYASTYAMFALGYALGLALGVWLYRQGQASIGTAFLITTYVGQLARPLESIRGLAEDLQQASASIGRVQALLAVQPSVQETPRSSLPGGALAVAFQDVTFGYNDTPGADETILHDLSFALRPGHVLGLLGRTGSGKTTLTRLLTRLYDPQEGAVLLGGTNLRDVSLSDLRRRIGVVTQDVQIFAASLRDNVTLFDRSISDDDIWRVLGLLGLHGLFAQLPNGLDTPLGSGGAGLSAGQAQLLACARVFLRDPGLIILDEASSRLDPATEALLERAIDRLLDGRTAIVIAHRLGTVRRADEIMVLERGRVLEHGPRAALAADPESRFAALLRTGMEEVLA